MVQRLHHRRARAAHGAAFFDRDQGLVGAGQLEQQLGVQRLGPAHIGHAGIERLTRLQSRVQQSAKRQNRHALARSAQLAFAKGQRVQAWVHCHAHARTTRVAHGHRVVLLVGGGEQLAALILVRRARHTDIRDAAQKRDVIGPGVGGAVGTHQARAVQRQHHGQLLQGHIVDQLVVGALQKGGVNSHHWAQALAGHASGKGECVLLGNADIVVAVGKAAVKLHHARALAHGRGDGHQLGVLRGHVAQPLAKHLGEGGFGGHAGWRQTHLGVEFARAVVGNRVALGQVIALAFARDHMQKLGPGQVAQVFQGGDQGVQIMPVNRADVVEAKLFKQGGGGDDVLGLLFKAAGEFKQRCGRAFEHLLAQVLGGGVKTPAHELRQIAVERAHWRADGHVVVVQDDQHIRPSHPGVVECLERHAGSHGAVANDGHRMPLVAFLLRRHGHAQRG